MGYITGAFDTSGNNCVRICKTALCHLGTTESIELPDWRRLTICIATSLDLCLRRRTLYARIAVQNWRTHARRFEWFVMFSLCLFLREFYEKHSAISGFRRCEIFLNINSADFFYVSLHNYVPVAVSCEVAFFHPINGNPDCRVDYGVILPRHSKICRNGVLS